MSARLRIALRVFLAVIAGVQITQAMWWVTHSARWLPDWRPYVIGHIVIGVALALVAYYVPGRSVKS
jgi:hypothetical protein